jgi:hypothetical protein
LIPPPTKQIKKKKAKVKNVDLYIHTPHTPSWRAGTRDLCVVHSDCPVSMLMIKLEFPLRSVIFNVAVVVPEVDNRWHLFSEEFLHTQAVS